MATEGETEEQKTVVKEDANQIVKEPDAASVELVAEDTASSSSREEEEDDDDDGDYSVDEDEEPMPLLSYTRLFGSLPRRPVAAAGDGDSDGTATQQGRQNRTFSVASTCAVMGQIVLPPEDPTAAAASSPDSTSGSDHNRAATSGGTTTPDQRRHAAPSSFHGDPLLSHQPHFVVATGFENGAIELVDARTGVAVVSSDQHQLRLRDASHSELSVVDLSMDSSGTFLAAVDVGRMVVIWEFKYTVSVHSPAAAAAASTTTSRNSQPSSNLSPPSGDEQQQQQQQQPSQQLLQHPAPSTPSDAGVFSSFMSALKGSTPTVTATTNATLPAAGTHQNPASPANSSAPAAASLLLAPRLATSSIQMSRISYPRSFGVPTCIAIDPSYKRKREKAVLTGFLDGRLVLTKRGFVFQRRTDAIIYQGTYDSNTSHGGIEAIEWRGSLVAWADASGIRLFDTESLTRIAHIDRPTGARPSLYPTLSSLRPTLQFETSSYLLVAWGDCLMGLSITDHSRATTVTEGQAPNHEESPATDSTPPSSQQSMQQQQPVVRRRTVECAMAWELDCVASGVVPLDSDHVLVLGLVPPSDDDDDDDNNDAVQPSNDLEVQVISREDGSIVFSNILPLLRNEPTGQLETPNPVAQTVITESAADYTLLSSFALSRMDDVYEASMEEENTADDEFDIQVSLFSPTSQAKPFVDSHVKWNLTATSFDTDDDDNRNGQSRDNDDTRSVDSDDYGFIFRPLSSSEDASQTQKTTMAPPQMIIASSSDIVLARMRDVDDAVSHALASGKSALALRRALKQKRRLRKYKISDLVNDYFISLMRIPRHDIDRGSQPNAKPLSIERLKLAAKAMPVLFGVDIALWERWVSEVEKIPGALFVLSDHLPVRDPKLPKELYGRVLGTMLNEIDQMNTTEDAQNTAGDRLSARAEQCFLNTLTGWGPTDFLKEHIKLCKFDGDGKVDAAREAEEWFSRRFTQSSSDYLTFPVPDDHTDRSGAGTRVRSEGYYDMKNALFDIDGVAKAVERRIPLISGADADSKNENSLVALDAMAKLHMMKFRYDAALKCFLFVGALHSARSVSDFESGAVEFSHKVGSRDIDTPWQTETIPYTYLLDVIDSHHLHQCLLDGQFMSDSGSKQTLPLFSLLQLVGLNEFGNFLIEHCVPPQFADKETLRSHEDEHVSTTGEERRGTLPLDLVARQLDDSPKILHWYLHLVFTRKPEVYVRFPNTAYPPRAVTELHRLHFDLYLDFAGRERDSASALSGVEAYKVGSVTTRLLLFLKAALPLGGIRPQDAKRALESERAKGEGDVSATFALELAYIIEHYGEGTESEAREVLDLYMKGAHSLVLAVSFAQRNEPYSSLLWAAVMEHCLVNGNENGDAAEDKADGNLFGSLLEAAALSGSDLALLVTQIPPGMAIEGLRPRLVAAVADYRLKLKMHEAASEAASQEMITILRELSHRSRRGVRYPVSSGSFPTTPGQDVDVNEQANPSGESASSRNVLDRSLRTIVRRDRRKLCLAPPLR